MERGRNKQTEKKKTTIHTHTIQAFFHCGNQDTTHLQRTQQKSTKLNYLWPSNSSETAISSAYYTVASLSALPWACEMLISAWQKGSTCHLPPTDALMRRFQANVNNGHAAENNLSCPVTERHCRAPSSTPTSWEQWGRDRMRGKSFCLKRWQAK